LPRHFANFDLPATENSVEGNRWANWRCHCSFFIKNIIFLSKSLCHCATLVTRWINITIIKSYVWVSGIAPWFRIVSISNSTKIVIWNLIFFCLKPWNHRRIRFMRYCWRPLLTFETFYSCRNVSTVWTLFDTGTIFPTSSGISCIAPRPVSRMRLLVAND